MQRSEVSVVVPCYNNASTLLRCLDSIASLTGPRVDVWIVDDGSWDASASLAEAWLEQSGLPGGVIRQSNAGAPAARNKGWRQSQAEWIQFLDADDALLPSKITDQLKHAQDAEVLVGGYERLAADGNKIKQVVYENGELSPEEVLLRVMDSNLGNTCANLFSRKALERVGGWNTTQKSSQEYTLFLDLLKVGAKFRTCAQVGTHIFEDGQTRISEANLRQNSIRYLQLRIQALQVMKDWPSSLDPELYYSAAFAAIRLCAKHDFPYALEMYRTHLPKGFVPDQDGLSSTGFLRLARKVGYPTAERLTQLRNQVKA